VSKSRGRPLAPEWKSTDEVCRLIPCSRWHLHTLRKTGVLKPKIHYRNISPLAARPTYRYHIDRVQKVIDDLQQMEVSGGQSAASTPQTPADEHPL
jgi:hypothetical protein